MGNRGVKSNIHTTVHSTPRGHVMNKTKDCKYTLLRSCFLHQAVIGERDTIRGIKWKSEIYSYVLYMYVQDTLVARPGGM